MTPGDRLTSRAYLATRTRPLDGADALHWSPDTAVPDPPRLVASYHAVPLDPDGEPWCIDPDVYRRLHRPAVTGRLTRRRRWPLRALAWCWRRRADAAALVLVVLAVVGAVALMNAMLPGAWK